MVGGVATAADGNNSNKADISVNETTSVSADVNSHLKTRFPKYFIIGFAKAGTKALYEALKMHPSLVGPMTEERFFTEHYKDGIQRYLESIPRPSPGQHTIEKSPDYITSPQAPQRLKNAALSLGIDPSLLKFIIIVRNPVARSVSDFIELSIYAARVGKKHRSLFTKEVLQHGTVNSGLLYINHSCYAYHISNWLKHFNRSQICFVDGDRFITAPYPVATSLEQCMGIAAFFGNDSFVFSQSKGFYCFRRNWNLPQCLGDGKGRPHPHVPRNILTKVRGHFKSCNSGLYSIIGQDLNWDASMQY